MLQLDEHILYALSPSHYPKPKEIDASLLRPKSKLQKIYENENQAMSRRINKLEVFDFFLSKFFLF
jgi:hypothetical protein